MNILKKLRLDKIASALVLATIFLITTACNSGNELGARPNNPPVQVGGQNNPHKAGGDGMTKYKATNDPRISQTIDNQSFLIATANRSETTYPTDDKNVEGLLYSNQKDPESLKSVDDLVSPETQKALKDPTQIPAVKQPILDRSDPDNKLLEKTKQMFEDANDF